MKESPRARKIKVSDHSRDDDQAPGIKDISITITALLMKIVGLWLVKDQKEQRRRDLTLIYTVIAILFGVWVQTRDFYYSWPNLGDCAYTGCNILCLAMVLLKLFVVFINRRQFIDLLLYTYKNFWHSNYDPSEKEMLAYCKRISTLCITCINVCVQATIFSYVLDPIVANIGRNASDRVLPFNMWLNLPLSTSPYYEILFVAQVLSLYHIGICYICFDNLLCLMSLHAATQFRILQYRLSNLGGTDTKEVDIRTSSPDLSVYAEKCYSSFKNYVRQHQAHIQYCHNLENVFTVIILGHVLVFSLLMCLVGYQIFLADGPATRRLIFIFNLIGNLSQLLLFTYSCNGLIEESMNIGVAVYSGPWTNLPANRVGNILRRDLKMVIIRSRKPCCLTASGFFPVSLETYTTVLKTAMSYFTLMRQSMTAINTITLPFIYFKRS